MGRRKISIKQIDDAKLRHITFNKRKNGLIKKAAELSMLCNVNMLLIFEDGNGTLVQYSRDKIKSIAGFFKECKYNNVLELSSKDYPNFFKVNHYKKHKDKEDGTVSRPKTRSSKAGRTFSQMRSDDDDQLSDDETDSTDGMTVKEENVTDVTPIIIGTEVPNSILPEKEEEKVNNPSPSSLGQNKIKNKLGLRLAIPKNEDSKNISNPHINNGNHSIAPPEQLNMKQTMEEQSSESVKTGGEKNMDFIASPYLTMGDKFQQPFAGLMDSSPFKFYGNNGKLKFLNHPAQGNEEPLSSILKGFSFAFPMSGNTPLPKNGFFEMEDKPLDTANIAALLRNTPFDHNKIFNFQNQFEQKKDNEENTLTGDLSKFGSQFLLTPSLVMDPSGYKHMKEFTFEMGPSDQNSLGENLKEGLDYRTYYGKVDELGDPRKKIKQD